MDPECALGDRRRRALEFDVGQAEPFTLALVQLIVWFDDWRPNSGKEPPRYVVCVGLAVLHRMRQAWPIPESGFISGLDVRTSGPLIRNILATYGIHRMYLSTGGRTSPAAVLAAKDLVRRLNAIAEVSLLAEDQQQALIDDLQDWLVEKVERYFAEHPLPDPPVRQTLSNLVRNQQASG